MKLLKCGYGVEWRESVRGNINKRGDVADNLRGEKDNLNHKKNTKELDRPCYERKLSIQNGNRRKNGW